MGEEVATIHTTHHSPQFNHLIAALAGPEPSSRLRAAMHAGTHPDPVLVPVLIERCAVEPDFFVRDMLTWALTRHPARTTVAPLVGELDSDRPQARSQALHTLSKIKDPHTTIPISLLHDADDEVARSAWRAAVVLVRPGQETGLAQELVAELGRGDREVQLSLSRALVALVALGDTVPPMLTDAMAHADPRVRAHAHATEYLRLDPDSEFDHALDEATRIVLTSAAPATD